MAQSHFIFHFCQEMAQEMAHSIYVSHLGFLSLVEPFRASTTPFPEGSVFFCKFSH
jgi:hypothetical protein